jgi:Holliday junction resolvase
MDPNEITMAAFRMAGIHFAISKEQSLDQTTLDRLTERVRQVQAGMGPEMEPAAAVNWLAKSVIVHRTDQTPMPKYHGGDLIRIPDIIAFSTIKGTSVPVAIEVKTDKENELVWSESYLQSLKRYTDALHIPLLVAWKRANMWLLFEARHFAKKVSAYHLSLETAFKENLMGLLFGDALIQLSQSLKFFIEARVLDELPPLPQILPQGDHKFKIKNAGFQMDGEIVNLPQEIFWAFINTPSSNEVQRTTEDEVRIEFTPEETFFSLTDFWITLALWNDQENPDWERILREEVFIRADRLREELTAGIGKGVRYIMNQVPHTEPEFLPQ